jgi:hypothetical protein
VRFALALPVVFLIKFTRDVAVAVLMVAALTFGRLLGIHA